MPTFGTVCDGIGCGHLAFNRAGFDCAWSFEIEAFPSAVLAYRFPDVKNHGDMLKCVGMIESGEIEAPDVFIGGTPCFAGEHMVLTELGYWPIKDVYPGCSVVTHMGRLCKVVRAGAKKALVGSLKGIGLGTIRCTSEHPFRSVAYRNQSTKRNNRYAKVEHIGEPEWTAAKDMPGKQWCALTSVAVVPASPLPSCVTEDEAMYLAGFYLGDGWIRKWGGKNKKAVVFGINEAKLVKLRACVTSVHLTIGQKRTGPRATICNTELAEWLLANFGRYSYGKTLPPWVLSHRLRGRLVQGYRDTDGGVTPSGWKAISTSRSLAYGMRDLVQTLGSVGSVMFHESPKTTVIDGRTVKQRNYWLMQAYDNDCSRKSRVRKGMLLRSVTSYEPEREETVYNIEVEGDNSYILDGAIVHNCQAFSVAGKRKGLEDARGNLSLTFCGIADAIDAVRERDGKQPCAVCWENVPGVLSDKGNAFGCFLGEMAGSGCELQPPGGRWGKSGCVFGPKRVVAWTTLDSQWFGVAQRRSRVFVVASAGDGCRPEEVLLIEEGMRRDSPPSREKGEGVAHDLAPSLTSSGRGVERAGETRGQDPVVAVCPTLRAGGNATGGHRPPGTDVDTCDSLIPVHTTGAGFWREGMGTLRTREQDSHENVVVMAHGQANAEIGKNVCPTLSCNHEVPIATYDMRGNGDGVTVGCPTGDHAGRPTDYTPVVAFEPRFVRTSAGGQPSIELNPCLRADTNAGDGVPCVAFSGRARGDDGRGYGREPQVFKGGITGPLDTVKQHAVATSGMQVRRLTPRECERLQGLPIAEDHVTIEVAQSEDVSCSDRQNRSVPADEKCRKSPNSASNAAGNVFNIPVWCAEKCFPGSPEENDKHVRVSVRINFEGSVLDVQTSNRLLLSVSFAEGAALLVRHGLPENFVQLCVGILTLLKRMPQDGKAESHQNMTHFTVHPSGNRHVLRFGQKTVEHVVDAQRNMSEATECLKYTTSNRAPDTSNCEQRLRILSSCVAHAISSYIRGRMPNASLSEIELVVISGWTLIPWRGKPIEECPDSPRYKAIGNGQTVTVMEWLARRIMAEMTR